jgi:pimeloyl-ACP methyl ester carboxylesterase
MSNTKLLERTGGQIAYDDAGGDGPLVIAAPGMGDTRRVYRHLTPLLGEAGLRVATFDLRGVGESSVGWEDLSDVAVASDYLALIDELDSGPAVLIGNSLSCASSVIAATEAPDKVRGIVLLGPFVRDIPTKWWQKASFAAGLTPPWGRRVWVSYYSSKLYPGPKPPDHQEYVAALADNLAEPGRFSSFRTIAPNSHAESGRRLAQVSQPTLVIMGTADPDFPDPIAEAQHLGSVFGSEPLLVEGSGHYPQADSPQAIAPAIVEFARNTVG